MQLFVVLRIDGDTSIVTVENQAPPGVRRMPVELTEESRKFLSEHWTDRGCQGYLTQVSQYSYEYALGRKVSYRVATEQHIFRYRYYDDKDLKTVIRSCILSAKELALLVLEKENRHVENCA
jgi:hypothetical protein